MDRLDVALLVEQKRVMAMESERVADLDAKFIQPDVKRYAPVLVEAVARGKIGGSEYLTLTTILTHWSGALVSERIVFIQYMAELLDMDVRAYKRRPYLT